MRHVIESQQYDVAALEKLFNNTDRILEIFQAGGNRQTFCSSCVGKHMILLFYEPSTRTRVSFQMAAHHLGMTTASTENAGEFSSAVKGETLSDTMHVICSYHPDVVVLRDKKDGSAHKAAEIADKYGVSIINAGDGKGQHPTQALLDVYTIRRELGKIEGKTVLMGGDLANGRTVRSLSYLLSKYPRMQLVFFSPPELQMGEDILEHLREHRVPFLVETRSSVLPALLSQSDVVYWTRFQKERHTTAETADKLAATFAENYSIGPAEMKFMRKLSILMHPLPRVKEISLEVDNDLRAAYFRQAQYGLYVRMAILQDMFGKK
jgi:aspartate carbamoyltransferase catalytic subunit